MLAKVLAGANLSSPEGYPGVRWHGLGNFPCLSTLFSQPPVAYGLGIQTAPAATHSTPQAGWIMSCYLTPIHITKII